MEFVNIDELLNEVLSEAVGCPIYTARDRIRWAAIEFCKQTGVSVETTSELDIEADEDIIELPSPSVSVRPWQVVWMKTTNGTVWPQDRRSLVEQNAKHEGLSGEFPLSYVRLAYNRVQFIPKPDIATAEALTIHCSYIPQRDATRIDAILIDEYRDAIVHGALYRLLKMSREEWADPSEAKERLTWFSIAQSEARALADKDFSTGEQTVIMTPLA